MCKILREILLSYVRKREIEMCFIQNLSHEMKHLTLKYRWNIGFCTLHESIWWSLRVISFFFALREISLFLALRIISLFFAQREILRERQRAKLFFVQKAGLFFRTKSDILSCTKNERDFLQIAREISLKKRKKKTECELKKYD